MCISTERAKFARTTVYAGLGRHPNNPSRIVHVVGYQNLAQVLGEGPNAMLLLLPAKGEIGPVNFLDLRNCRRVMDDVKQAIDMEMIGSRGGTSRGMDQGAAVFEHDIYTMIVAEDVSSIPEALKRVPEHKRPSIKPALLEYLARCPQRQILICCFDNRDATQAAPLFMWYEPLFPSALLAPAIDCHTGEAPPKGEVTLDHQLVLGTTDEDVEGYPISYQDEIPPQYHSLLPRVAHSVFYDAGTRMMNGDFVIPVDKLTRIRTISGQPKRFLADNRRVLSVLRFAPDTDLDRAVAQFA